jgi:hypothetical protein
MPPQPMRTMTSSDSLLASASSFHPSFSGLSAVSVIDIVIKTTKGFRNIRNEESLCFRSLRRVVHLGEG